MTSTALLCADSNISFSNKDNFTVSVNLTKLVKSLCSSDQENNASFSLKKKKVAISPLYIFGVICRQGLAHLPRLVDKTTESRRILATIFSLHRLNGIFVPRE